MMPLITESLLLPALLLAAMLATIAALLLFAKQRYGGTEDKVVAAINQCLPQTQCAQCGHPGCLPYAQAIAQGEAINRCPPGGKQTIAALADLLGRDIIALDNHYGQELPKRVARIREAECIGCTLCIQACPVDAIIGAQQQMHSILEDSCTGCDLCLPPCPVDCIDMIEIQNVDIEQTKPLKPLVPKVALQTETACIRCGDCEVVCPKELQPQMLFWQRSSIDSMTALNLDACIECRLCDRVCPSAIPLTQYFQAAKQSVRAAEQLQAEAVLAEQRFEKRQSRLIATEPPKAQPTEGDRKALLARLGK
ncbi:MAG: electron transport complex protein RnfB [Candidatus Azotimanducaceae bacterium]|jgi:electron transport complex protein RnfB